MTTAKPPERVVLGGVPYVGPDMYTVGSTNGTRHCLEGSTFPSTLRACMEYVGDTFGYKVISVNGDRWRLDNLYTYLVGMTGCAFRLNWGPGWGLDNSAMFQMADDAGEPYRRAIESLGFSRGAGAWKGEHDEAGFRRHIIEGLHEYGMPVLAHGVVGPPESSLITGYDEGGDVLIGWSYYQGQPGLPVGWWGDLNRDGVVEWNADRDVEFGPSGYFRKRNWYQGTWDVSCFRPERGERPPLSDAYRDGLAWALKVVRTPVTHGKMANGLAAYGAWAEALQRDADFPKEDLDVLRDRYMVHTGATRVVAEGRWYAARFLEEAAETEPGMTGDLLAAVACYEAEHCLMWEAWHLVGYETDSPLMWHDWTFRRADVADRLDEYARTLARSEVREQIVSLVRQAQAKDAEAIEHIERALEAG